MTSTPTDNPRSMPMGDLIGQLVSVFKLRIGIFIMVSALAGLAVTPGPKPDFWLVVLLALTVLASSAAAGAYNQYAERDIDALMTRTKNRPFVTGALRFGAHWLWIIIGLLGLSVGISALALGPLVGLYIFLGAFVYGVVYTVWLKRRTAWNIVVGGLAGSFALMAGAVAVDPGFSPIPITLAIVMFLWTPPHFWSLASALAEDYEKAGVPMLPSEIGEVKTAWIILAHTIALVALSILPFFWGLGYIYLICALTGGAHFTWRSIQHARWPGRDTARANFFASLIQLSLLYAGIFLDAFIGL